MLFAESLESSIVHSISCQQLYFAQRPIGYMFRGEDKFGSAVAAEERVRQAAVHVLIIDRKVGVRYLPLP